MNRSRIAILCVVVAAVLLAACGDNPPEAATEDTQAAEAQPFRVYERALWSEAIIVGSKAVLVGKAAEAGSEVQVRTVDAAGDTTETELTGTSPGHVSATGKDDSGVIIGLRPCEAIGPSGGSSEETTCTKYGAYRLIDHDLDDRTTSDVSVPDDLQRLLDDSNGVDVDAYSAGTLFATLQDEAVLTEVRWDMDSDTFLSSPIDTNSSADVGSTCVTDDGVRYDTVVTNGSYATFIDGLEEGPTHVERRPSTGERTITDLPQPPTAIARWETACIGTSAFVAAGGTNTLRAAQGLDYEVLPTSEVFGPSADVAGPQPPAQVLRLPELTQIPQAPTGHLGTDSGRGGVFSDDFTVELLKEDGTLTAIPWIPPGTVNSSGDVLVVLPSTQSTPDTSVFIDLDRYDDAASKALREQMYG